MENYVEKHDKLMRYLGMSIDIARQGYAKVSMPLSENIKNGMGVAHGGAIFSLADVAFGAAVNAEAENCVVSLFTTIEFLRPGKTGPLTAEANVTRAGQHVQSYDVKVFDGSGELVAKCMASGFQTDIPLSQ
ncbi:MAG: PaaI family thioesterase [Desulfovibrio sp.]|jgi:acyl-CoA thioesterase|nr:PaaI family thioesterase [Desulfovibrio sp.]